MTDQPDPRLVTRPALHAHDPAVWAYGADWLRETEQNYEFTALSAPTQKPKHESTRKQQ